MKKTTILIASVLLLLNTACTTIKPIYDTDDATYSSQVKAGGAGLGIVVAIPFIALGLLLTGASGGSSY